MKIVDSGLRIMDNDKFQIPYIKPAKWKIYGFFGFFPRANTLLNGF